MSHDPRRGPASEDPIADLVRLAGPREAAPAARAARVKETLRGEWEGVVRRRRRIRLASLGAAAALLLAAALILRGGSPSPPGALPTAEVTFLDLGAWARPAGQPGPRSLQVGQRVAERTELATEGEGRLALRLASGASLRLDLDTRVTIVSASELRLTRGAVYVDAGPADVPRKVPVEVHTPYGVVSDVGTQFDVRLAESSMRIRVREGLAVLRRDEGEVSVPAGVQVEVDAGGGMGRRAVPVHGPGWAWVESLAPSFDLEGRTAAEFLRWIARERGWTLQFADETVARSAAGTVMSGSLEGIALEDALEVVLPTCRLSSRIEGGALVVSSSPEEP